MNKALQELRRQGQPVPGAMDRAARAMGEAQQNLSQDQMGSAGEEAVRRDYAQEREREREGQQSYLLKAEEGTDLKKIVFNRFNEVDAEAIIAGDAYRERRPMGKIEEGEETFTRRFQSRH